MSGQRLLAKERPVHILQATALVHEAYLQFIDWQNVRWQNRAHFFRVVAQMMRHILVDYAVKQKSEKRGDWAPHGALEEAAMVFSERNPDLVALDASLDNLAALNPIQSRVIELHFFGGLALKEIAEALGMSLGVVKRDMTLAKL